MKFTFNSKETYLQYRAAWREQYYHLIGEVRKEKLAIRAAMSAYSKGTGSISDIWSAQSSKRVASEAVQQHLYELWDAKQEAGRQMAAART